MESTQKITELDKRLSELELENERLIQERSEKEIEEMQLKKQS